jgi:selenocysteine lyase/cysteine desulfurase
MTPATPSILPGGIERDSSVGQAEGSVEVRAAIPAVVGHDLRVPLVTGGYANHANLDHAASAPCLKSVRDAVNELLPWYASVHRGAGFASQVCTGIYEDAREKVRRFVGATPTDAVVFTRNTTDALNLLARTVPPRTSVVVFDSEHHAALLPWSAHRVSRLPVPDTADEAIESLDAALAECPEGPRLVVLTGASNVTGEVWPVAELARIARRHGARSVLDAAQLVPHRPVRMQELGVDYLALSGHKLYAPFGAGALIGDRDWLDTAEPYLAGGGASRAVEEHGVSWTTGAERHEAGSPNTVGAHALAAACETFDECGWAPIIEHERALLARLDEGLRTIPGLHCLRLFGSERGDAGVDRVGVVSFALDNHDPGLLAAALSAEYGIGVRDGLFCAHLAVRRLLQASGCDAQRAVRVSIGLGTTARHIDRFLAAVRELVTHGPKWTYEQRDGRWQPVDDSRAMPLFRSA